MTGDVDHGKAGTFPSGDSGEDHQPARLGLDKPFVILVFGVRPFGTEAGYGAVNQVWTFGLQRFITDAQRVCDAGFESLDHHIGALGQLADLIYGIGIVQVKNHALLAPVPEMRLRNRPVWVALRRLDLYDFSPEVRQGHRGDGAGHPLGEV